ncbi:MAG: hypothetical protein IPI97_14495 [Nitrosomonas sp.]|nr:hypothetical protein [Nitrosomonas sp.]
MIWMIGNDVDFLEEIIGNIFIFIAACLAIMAAAVIAAVIFVCVLGAANSIFNIVLDWIGFVK